MSTHRHIDKICAAALLLSLLLALLFVNGEALGIQAASRAMGYEDRLFDTAKVHTIDIVMDDWESFIETCENEEYAVCTVVIDGESYNNVGIRAKGNTSLSTVSSLDSDRYSFKIEFDQYDSTKSYHGLDKLSLNNLIQDATMMKDYLTYQLMGQFGAASPLCSYAYITVNGKDWGLYLAVEGIEESFLRRNYGSGCGELYKPDTMDFGGGRGNGRDFNMEDFMGNLEEDDSASGSGGAVSTETTVPQRPGGSPPEGFDPSAMSGGAPPEDAGQSAMPGAGDFGGGDFGGMGSEETRLQYIDDDPDSYSAIFSSAKTDLTEADQTRLIASLKALSAVVEDIEDVVDVEQVIRYFVVHNFVVNGDSYTGSMIHNYYLYEEDGALSMLPWDYNLAFGTFQGGDASSSVNDPIDTPLSSGSGDLPMLDWIFDSETYTALYHQYFAEFLDSADFAALIDQTAELIAPYVERDPSKFYTYEEFETGVATLREFCLLRAESVRGQLEGVIPSTTEGQQADGSGLVDASHLTLSAMGSMGGGMGGGFPGAGGFGDGGFAAGGFGSDGAGTGDFATGASGADGAGTGDLSSGEGGTDPWGGSGAPAFGQQPPNFSGTLPSGPVDPAESASPSLPEEEGQQDGEENTSPQASGEAALPEGGGQRPGSMDGFGEDASGGAGSGLLLLGISAAVLLLGLFIALKFKR